MLSLSSKRGEQTDLPDGGAHQRHHHDYDVVVEIKVWQSYQEVTDTPDGHFSQTFITLKRHGLTSLLLLLLPVWNSIRSDDGEENEWADGKSTEHLMYLWLSVPDLPSKTYTGWRDPPQTPSAAASLFSPEEQNLFKWVSWYIYFLCVCPRIQRVPFWWAVFSLTVKKQARFYCCNFMLTLPSPTEIIITF